ncbi:MAG: galactose mutarotase [Elusimicrobiota bacterium]|jgi:aldose 1-epimerase|nr:galactose mutarotase [Elusimicrobiota bacterium]
MKCVKKNFGILNNRKINLFVLSNDNGFSAGCISYGAALQSLYFPDAPEKSVVLGFDNLRDYVKNKYYLGVSLGRTAGRIGGASFKTDGVVFTLSKNEGKNTLHGGENGFHRIIWNAKILETGADRCGVKFFTVIKPEYDGFPGEMQAEISYILNNSNELEIIFKALSDKTTLFNPSNHAYFNLGKEKTILNHCLQINAPYYLELNDENIPTGRKINTVGTAYDFTKKRLIGTSLKNLSNNYSIKNKGLDTPYCLNSKQAAVLEDENSARRITVLTDRNALVAYSANYFESGWNINGENSVPYMGIALEAQTLPDAPNHEDFGNIILRAGEVKEYRTVFKMEKYNSST